MAIHPPTNQHRNATPSHKSAPTPPHAAAKGQGTCASRKNHPLALMGKTALSERVAQRSRRSVKARAVVHGTLETIPEALSGGDEGCLTGLGSFGVRMRAAQRGVNPQTHAWIQLQRKTG